MKYLFTIALSFIFSAGLKAQYSVTTTNSFANNNGSGTVTFHFQNTNAYPVIITDIDGVTGTSGTVTTQFYYKTTLINGSPGTIDATGGWTLVASGSITGVANTSSTTTQNFLTGLSFVVPANTTYAFAVFGTSQRYSTIAAGTHTDSAFGVKIITGTNIGYGGGTPPTAPTNSPRGWIGTIKFVPALPCSGTPTAGTATSSASLACSGQPFQLSLSGDSIRQNLKYQWQSSSTGAANSYANMTGDTTRNISKTQTAQTWYRCRIICGVDTAYSGSVQVSSPTGTMSGTYTVDTSIAISSTNYHSLNALVTYLSCAGVSAPVSINIAPGLGTLTGQLNFGNINGTSATNTVTINGNGNTITSAASPLVTFNGTKYVTLRNCTITGGTSYAGFGVHIGGLSQHIRLTNNVIDVGTSSTSSTNAGIVVSGSQTTATTAGNNAHYLSIDSNLVIGGYYSLTLAGNTSYSNNFGHVVRNNTFRDFYLYGVYVLNGDTIQIRKNKIERPTRATISTFYGVYLSASRNIKIHQNSIRNAGTGSYTAYPFYVANNVNTTGFETEIVNNEVYNINTTGTFYGLYSLTTGLTNAKIYHNTIHHNTTGGTGTIRGLFFNIAQSGVELRNNIISIEGSGTGTKHCIYVGNITGSGNTYNNNVYYMGATAGTNYMGYWGSAQSSLSDWQTTTSMDANSVSTDPSLAGISSGDLTPYSTLVNNIGANVGVTHDIRNISRSSSTPDPGAYEFTPSSCPPPSGVVATLVGTDSVRLNWTSSATVWNIEWDTVGFTRGTGTMIRNITSKPITIGGLVMGGRYDFYVQDSCSTAGSSWVLTTVTVNYCTSNATNTADTKIDSVFFAGRKFGSALSSCETYTNYNAPGDVINLTKGVTSPLQVINGSCSNSHYTAYVKVWIDYNGDLVYNDTNELVLNYTGGTTQLQEQNILSSVPVPLTAKTGRTGMRVVIQESAAPTSCGTYTYGETEDYWVNLINPILRDAGITAADSTLCEKFSTATATLKNFAVSPLTSVTIHWGISENGGPYTMQSPVNWTGSLAQNNTTVVNLGVAAYDISKINVLKVFTSLPNAGADEVYTNDTLLQRLYIDSTPAITFALNPVCLNVPAFTPAVSPSGGLFTGSGIYGNKFYPDTTATGVGAHLLSYVVTGLNGCIGADTASQHVLPLPSVSVSSQPAVCIDAAAFALTGGLPAGGSYSGTAVSGGNFDPAMAAPGLNKVTYTVTGTNNCSNSADTFITVFALPVVSQSTYADVCSNAPAFLLTGGTPSGGTYSGPGITGGSFSPATAGTGAKTIRYSFTDANNCSAFSDSVILVLAAPSVTIATIADVCDYSSNFVLVGGTPVGGVYSGAHVSADTFKVSSAGVGIHPVRYVFTNTDNCTDSAFGNVLVGATPSFNLGNDTAICGKQTLVLDPGLSAMDYTWNDGSTQQTLTVSSGGTFYLLVKDPATTAMCQFSDTIEVDYSAECTGISESLAAIAHISYFPNPNNGLFTLRINGLEGLNAKLFVTDATGRLITSMQFEQLPASFVQPVLIQNAATGVYYLNLVTDKGTAAHIITIQR